MRLTCYERDNAYARCTRYPLTLSYIGGIAAKCKYGSVKPEDHFVASCCLTMKCNFVTTSFKLKPNANTWVEYV